MKNIFLIATAVLALAVLGAAQYGGRMQQTPPPPASSAQAPSSPNQQASAPGQAQNPPPGQNQLAPKTKEEYDAWKAAASEPDLTKAEAAAKDFETKYPESKLRSPLYQDLMAKYEQAGNQEKTLEMGHKVLQVDPDSVFALLTVASVIAQRSRVTDLNWDENYAEVSKDAKHAIQLIDSGAFAPPQVTKAQLNAVESTAYVDMGIMDLNKKNDAAAEQLLRKAVELNTLNPDPTTWLRLAVALDHEKKYPEALDAVNHAVQYSADDQQVLNLSLQEQTRLKQLIGTAAQNPASSGGAASAPAGTKAPPAPGSNAKSAQLPAAPQTTVPH